MPSFTPPVNDSEVPNSGPDDPRWMRRAMGHFSRGDRCRNVYILDGTTVTEQDPTATYDADGVLVSTALERTTRFFQGGATHTVTAAEQALLEAAGYTVDP